MVRKIVAIFSLIAITALVGVFLYDSNSSEKIYEQTFRVDATYYPEQKIVKITFDDKSKNTNSVILEILGMDKSYQKTFHESSFTQIVDLMEPSSYGWKIHPITLLVDHKTLGKVAIKTEIHNQDQPIPPVIYGLP